jgi:hypothetical protein
VLQPLDGAHLRRAGEHPHRDGQVEGAPDLGDVSRGQVQRVPARREVLAAVRQRGMDAVAGLLHRALRQADHVEGGNAAGDVGLHGDQVGVDAEHGPGGDSREQGEGSGNGRDERTDGSMLMAAARWFY